MNQFRKPPRPRKQLGKRILRLAIGLALGSAVLVAALAGALLVHLRTTSAQSDLSPREWQMLRTRLLRYAVQEARAPETAPALPESASPGAREAPAPPARIPLPEMETAAFEQQRAEYVAVRAKSVLELQPYRRTVTMELEGDHPPIKSASLVNLNPLVNSWYLLTLEWPDGRRTHHHLVNAHPRIQDLTLDTAHPEGITLVDTTGRRPCDLWSDNAPVPIASAETARTPYLSVCDEEITLRLIVPGRRTTLEWATDFLRDNVWSGEQITTFVRENFFQDAYLERAEIVATDGETSETARSDEGPLAARLDSHFADVRIGVGELGLALDAEPEGGVTPGRWYRTRHHRGVYVSVVRPDVLDPEIYQHHRDVVSRLDEVERGALVYLVAFDLARFDVGFALGTEHPRVRWSERALSSVRDPSLPGPDGIGDVGPLVTTGIVPRSVAARTVATFTGGFKRDHGAFRVSELASRNRGSHYGFIESGAILSKLQPGLATVFVLEDGQVDMKTWSEEDDALLPRIEFARQNGLPLIEPGADGTPVPGRHVSQWAAGNWSGSQDRKFRTVRAGAALQEDRGRRFLIYSYFSSATPSAMVRVFEAYGCRYGMLLDMNALEHTYMALYRAGERSLDVQHLVTGMEVLDKSVGDQTLPRFLGFADNRDFFYLVRKGGGDEMVP